MVTTLFLFLLLYHGNEQQTIVAVLDTGVNKDHPLLKGRTLQGYDFVNFDPHPEDTNGHGTAVSSIITSMNTNKRVKILPIKMIGRQNDSAISILYSIFHGADIINMSFHAPYNFWTKLAISYGTFKGIIFVGASGNEGKDTLVYPAKYHNVISVVATNTVNTHVLGNYGDGVNYIAPGIHLKTATLNGKYTYKSGTSLAAAYVSGTLAFLKTKYPHATKKELINLLNSYSRSVLYHIHQNTYLFKTVDFKKVKALETDKSYFWLLPPKPYSNQTYIWIPIDSSRINKIYVYDNNQLFREYGEHVHHLLLPTSEGPHHVIIIYGGNKHWQQKQIQYNIDMMPPIITTSIEPQGKRNLINIHIKEKHLDIVTVNGQIAKPRIDFDHPIRDFYAFVKKGEKIKIIATDLANNRTIDILE